MDFGIFTLCDFAQEVKGKLTIVGTFDTILATKLPAVLPTCSLAALIRYNNDEVGKYTVKISFLSDSGEEIIPPIPGKLDIKLPSGQEWGAANIAIGIGLLKFPSYGRYSVNLLLDDKQIKSLNFYVKKQE